MAVAEAIARYGFHVVGQAWGCAVQFYAISVERKLTHPAVVAITSNARGALFGEASRRAKTRAGRLPNTLGSPTGRGGKNCASPEPLENEPHAYPGRGR